ncbi:MAG: hypothetical protein JW767_01080 [Thermoleophilia bacterium]|nr:hypothetical protein [Thermoleophilia bacterium]
MAALLAALTVWVDRGGFIALPEDRLLRIENDDYVHVTYTLATLRKSPPGERTAYYFGGSGAMDCIVGGPSLGAAVATAGGGELPVISLAAHAQSLGQTLALVECLPDTPAVLLVGLAPMRFTTAPGEDARLLTGRPMPIRSERLASVLGERYDLRPSAIAPLPGILDYIAGYFRARHEGDRGWLTSLAYDPHYQGDRVFKTAVMKRREAAGAIARDRQEYAAHGSYNVAVLEELLALAGERGHAVVLFDQPLNVGVAEETWGGVIPAYRREVRRLAATYDAVYIDSGAWRLPDAAFGDVYHLVPSARRSWEAAFARALAPALRTATGSAPAP